MARARLQKILASAGLASRRAAEAWLRDGRVTVNGQVAALGDSADPDRDVVALDGERVVAEPLAYWLVHKPRGVVTTASDPEGRPTVVELAPDAPGRLFPVGRLDRDTEGLVLLTNDGPLAHALLHPSHEVEREYRVSVRGRVRARVLRALEEGVELEDGRTAPARAGDLHYDSKADTSSFTLVLIEGRKRQIRRALAALRHPVVRLLRVRMGSLRLGSLAPGAARPLSGREQRALLRAAGAPAGRAQRPGRSPRRGS